MNEAEFKQLIRKRPMSRFVAIVGLLVICVACQQPQPEGETPIARVMNEYLYASDLDGVIAPGALQADSIEAVHAYIHNWIQQKLLIQKAKKNLPDHQTAFEQEIENYRNSLIIFTYQNALIEQALDTVITETQIENYFEENKELFLLKNNIVRVRFAKLENHPKNSRDRAIQEKIRKQEIISKLIFSSLTGEESRKLSDLCQEISINYFLNSGQWVYFNDLLKEIPMKTHNPSIGIYNQEDFLRKNREFQMVDGNYIYFVNILEYRLIGNFSPIEFEREKIRNILLNNRKVRLIESLRNEVVSEGREKKWFEIY
ncbi:MAG: hypothetical protein LBH22_02840 [Bacteroidales bacterium]|jgi:hypothetical protein|nr:hypothetical protein [Bacteroidales bacterium]